MRLSISEMETFIPVVMEEARVTEFLPELKPKIVIDNWKVLMEVGSGRAYGIAKEGKPIGFLLAIHSNDLFSGRRKAFEFLFEVVPTHRSDKAAMELLSDFEQGAREDGCEKIVVGCHAVHRPEALARWYQRKGFQFVSAEFEREVTI